MSAFSETAVKIQNMGSRIPDPLYSAALQATYYTDMILNVASQKSLPLLNFLHIADCPQSVEDCNQRVAAAREVSRRPISAPVAAGQLRRDRPPPGKNSAGCRG